MKFQLYTVVTFFLGTSCFQTDDFHIQGLNALRKTVNEFKSAHQGRLRMGNDDPTPVLIEKAGYPVEIHMATTHDGYILEMHRIPHGKINSSLHSNGTRPVVYIQHCLLCSSAEFVLRDPPTALGFMLADLGYDVWLGNYRGNTYSRRHEHLDPENLDFWQWSWHEMGMYDLPAMIAKTLETSGQDKLFYVGHSMGTTGFMVMSAMHPEMNEKIELASLMAPVAYLGHARSPLHYLAPFADQIDWILENLFGYGEFLPSSALMDTFADLICDEDSVPQLCESIFFLLCGFDSGQANLTLVDTIVHHTPAGSSSKTLVHYAQEMASDKFCRYDFGPEKNLEVYGQEEPPEYDVTQITAPVALYWSDNDWLAEPVDVMRLSSQLPNLFASYEVPFAKWNHLDFLYGIDADVLVYQELLKDMEEIRKLKYK